MKKRNKLVFVLIILVLVFFFVPIPGINTTYPPPRNIHCTGFCYAILVVNGSPSYWLTGYGGLASQSNTFPYVEGYWIAFG